jgi:hypothetical protein
MLANKTHDRPSKIQDLEKALAEQREASGKKISDIIERLRVLFEEYERSLNEFSVRPTPLLAN